MSDSIFFDTSIIEGDYRLRSGNLLHLVNVCKIAKVKMILPAVVFSDLSCHYCDNLNDVIENSRKINLELDRFVYSGVSPKIAVVRHQELINSYEHWLSNRLKNLGIIIYDYPKIAHQHIIKRASAKRKPFKDHDMGYKDTLIWETILEYLKKTSNTVIFLSNDRDFGNSDLHKDLVDDLTSSGIEHNRIILFKDFRSTLEYLYSKYSLSNILEDEQRAQWVSITKEQLKNIILFKDAITSEKSSLERVILLNDHLYTFNPKIERLISLSNYIDLLDVDFVPSYTGNGIWKLDGKALIVANANYRNLIGSEISPFGRQEPIWLDVNFTIYYDYSKETIVETKIRSVDNHIS
jgi:hypothetical protein